MADLHDHDLERGTLRWLIDNPVNFQKISLKPDDFHDETYRDMFKLAQLAFSETGYIDHLLFKNVCREQVPDEAIEDVLEMDADGGLHYADAVKEYSNKRKLIRMLSDATEMVESNAPDCLDKFSHMAYEVQKNFETVHMPLSVEEMAEKYDANWKELKAGGARIFRSGYELIDDYVCFQPKKTYCLAARSSIGKTALAQTMGVGFGSNGAKTLYFSLEMDYVELCDRMLSVYSGVSNTKFKYGHVPDQQYSEALKTMREKQQNFRLHWDPALSLPKIVRIAHDMKNRFGLDVIVVDYLQLIRPHYNLKPGEMHHFISSITTRLKQLAGELDCAIIELSQITRGGDEKRPPTLSQLKESGSIENDSDVVLMLHRESRDAFEGEVVIAKNRSGPAMGTISLDFRPETTLYIESSSQTLTPLVMNKKIKEQLQFDSSL